MTLNFFKTLAVIGLFVVTTFAQEPAHWSLSSESTGKAVKSGESISAQLKAQIDEGWHLYALDQPTGGPIPTTIKIADGSPFSITGDITAPKPTVRADQNFVVEGK